MTFGCPLFALLANRFSLKSMLIVGTIGFVPYSVSLYANNRFGTEWCVLVGAVTCGISAAALWTTESAIAVGYAPQHQRGLYVAIWLGLREFGQILGAAIQLSLNHRLSGLGKVNHHTYLVLIGLQCLGLPLALAFSPPHKAIRPDGSVVSSKKERQTGTFHLQNLFDLTRQYWMCLIVPVCMCFQFNAAYQSIYLTRYFSVRARTLASLTSGVAVTVADFGTAWFLDLKGLTAPTKAKVMVLFSSTLMLALLAWQLVNEYDFAARSDIAIDWSSSNFGHAFTVHILIRWMNEMHVVFIFWLAGAFLQDREKITIACGLINGWEAAGSTLSNGIAAARIAPSTNLWVSFALFTVAVVPTVLMAWQVPDLPPNRDTVRDKEDSVAS
jgi:hypothetical protein